MSDERTAQPVEAAGTGATEETAAVAEGSASHPGPAGAIRETLYKQPGSREQTPATEAVRADLRDIQATTVLMDRSGAERISAERVVLERSGSRTIDTKSAQLERSGVLALGSDHTVLLNSSAVSVTAEEARITGSRIALLNASSANVESSRILLFTGSTEGQVNATLTGRAAAVFGATFALVLGLLVGLARARSDD